MEIQSSNYAIQNPQIGLPSGQELTYQTNQSVAPAVTEKTDAAIGLWIALAVILFVVVWWWERSKK